MGNHLPKMAAHMGKPVWMETWFDFLVLSGCLVAGWLLCEHVRPAVSLNPESIQTVAMAKLFAEGHWLDALSRFNQPPVYAAMLAGVIKAMHTTRLPELMAGFLNLNTSLYLSSILLVYAIAHRHVRKPYPVLVAGLYAVAPSTLWMAWTIGPGMAFVVISLAALGVVDKFFGKKVQFPVTLTTHVSRGELMICCALTALSVLTLQAGYFLLLAFFLVCLKRLGLRRSVSTLAFTILAISPLIGRDIAYGVREVNSYTAPVTRMARDIRDHGWTTTLKSTGTTLVLQATHQTVGDVHLSAINPQAPNLLETDRLPWVPWVLATLLGIGLLYGLTHASGITSVYLAAYGLGALALLPADSRLALAPVVPLALLYLYYGVMRSGEWFKQLHLPVSRILGPALTVWILLCAGTTLWSQGLLSQGALRETEAAIVAPEPPSGKVMTLSTAKEPENRLEVAQQETARKKALQWLTAKAPNARVAIPRPTAASLISKQQGDKSGLPNQLQSELHRYDYLVEEGGRFIPDGRQDAVNGLLQLVYEDSPGKIRIWQIQALH